MNSQPQPPAQSQAIVLACENVYKSYQQGPEQLAVLQGVNLQVAAGEMLAIVGASGSGKSTLLNMLGGLDLPSQGSVSISGQSFNDLSETQRGFLRQQHLGFVYQFHHLLGEFSALENVAMPLLLGSCSAKQAKTQATDFLQRVGLGQRLQHKPSELSGGERQRVAIARALVTAPQCVLMDEPTGNLDQHTADDIHQLMAELNRNLDTSFIIVTHDMSLAQRMNKVYSLFEGQLHLQAEVS
ncbi:lipoprotein-releasing ABC transporter ATP-binding protein LolD [Dasania sp. GY-MA-18]|uniref:Lipoprotein-releasing system ATP-binding protein LolD n=1 Tax=Dasania phycosphaerae TaxID=2950436 RepID=A0A9J6RJA3_9GAMM|nr:MULTISPECIES: lipoprotein-releasing ABC transporter ATP-binding protein LolD [Dasania]MCR8921900.1 lipoprotein-releasing ABC transporter ATP-binding protein LolD [Dasania sp. GY-MA-18]MCZ0864328.1 lipoprotein-releasing ABC transporter ATP-binding protein LolD [Dasania phycosphaerae]MCZ0868056.1 lipoprotein-releasing ABC transporter ATP-binding protein LolD [Dasania phycosphaerae]